jgi:hypothetical protein
MEFDRPAVKFASPVGDHKLMAVPASLDVNALLSQEEILLFDPFKPGMSIKKEPMMTLNFSKLASGIIVESVEQKEEMTKSARYQTMMNNLHAVSNAFWPANVSILIRLLSLPKRDNGRNLDISPDMGLVVQKPKQKPEGPKNTKKPGPPKPGR